MPRPPSRLLVFTLSVIALVLLPALAMALPQGEAVLSAAERPEAGSGLFSRIWGLLSVLWEDTGSILDPNGTESGGSSGTEPNPASTGDTGSGLEPDGRP